MNSKYTLKKTADRILSGIIYQIAIKEHIDLWNKTLDPLMFYEKPDLVGHPHLDAWLAGAAHYEAYLIDQSCPEWAMEDCRFLRKPFFFGGENSKNIALVETPFPFRMRMVFTGKTSIRQYSLIHKRSV